MFLLRFSLASNKDRPLVSKGLGRLATAWAAMARASVRPNFVPSSGNEPLDDRIVKLDGAYVTARAQVATRRAGRTLSNVGGAGFVSAGGRTIGERAEKLVSNEA